MGLLLVQVTMVHVSNTLPPAVAGLGESYRIKRDVC
ncbi:hypothetical protein KS4_27160 [Poriferisphaera corsica]|uniref:Uncharacterized protein n=1 Tax=Poriferisphaera corsica TaxID=2528020 RepID=A0A517YWN1_9BACT|nr:hypothetical protein KS4_27160 [Poriferisphaera corsica]